MDSRLWSYIITSGSFPFLHFQQGRLAETYRRWDAIQHFNKELYFPPPTAALENPSVIVSSVNNTDFDIDSHLIQNYAVVQKTKCHKTDIEDRPGTAFWKRSYQNSVIKLPWKIRHSNHLNSTSQRCKCIIVLMKCHPGSCVVDGIEQLKIVHKMTNSPKELVVIVESPEIEPVQFESIKIQILDYLKEEIPGWLSYQEINEMCSKIYHSSNIKLDPFIQENILFSLLRYAGLFYDHCLQAFQMFDTLVEEEEENATKRDECRRRYLQRYKEMITDKTTEMETKVKEALDNSESFLLQETHDKHLEDLKNKTSKEQYNSKLWSHLLTRISHWILEILQAFAREVSNELTKNSSIGNKIYSICMEGMSTFSDTSNDYYVSFLQTLKDFFSSLFANLMKYFIRDKEKTYSDVVYEACKKLKENANNTSQDIVKSFIKHHLETFEEHQNRILETGHTRLLNRLKTDSYRLKLEVNSVVRDILEKTDQPGLTGVGQTLRCQVETEEVRQLITRAKGVKSYGINYDKLKINVSSKNRFMNELEEGLRTDLLKLGVYDLDVVESGEESTWTPACISSGNKVHVHMGDETRFGTVGALVRTHEKLAFISAAHVLSHGDSVSVKKAGSDQSVYVGECIWSRTNEPFSGLFDLSLVELNENYQSQTANVGTHQHIDGRRFPYKMYEGEFSNLEGKVVFKNGAKTEFTEGTFVCKEEFPDHVNEGRTLDAWIVEPTEEYAAFIEPGDSGSTVYTFESHRHPQIQFISIAQGQGQGKDDKKSFTSAFRHSIQRYQSSTRNIIHVNL